MMWLPIVFVVLGPLLGFLLGKIAAEELRSAERYLRLSCWILSGVGLVLMVWLGVAAFVRGFNISLYLIMISILFLDGLCFGILFYQRRWNNETKE